MSQKPREVDHLSNFEHYISVGREKLRCGYTTGTCAAASARGAAELLLTGALPPVVRIDTPAGVPVEVELLEPSAGPGWASCAVRKDGGDDPDATHGTLIFARVERCDGSGVTIDGGEGVGRVTKPGLDQPVGAAAINHVPRQMIGQQVAAAMADHGCDGGLKVVISAPEGEKLAQKTFNPRLGIVGGISILGTSGIVEPMSAQALVETIALELRQTAAEGTDRVVLTPGNYGADFLAESGLITSDIRIVKCSNFIGEALDRAAEAGIRQLILVGHLGKLVKVAGGVMNTHSRWADCRMEILCAHAALCGAGQETARALMGSATTDAGLDILAEAGLLDRTMDSLLSALQAHLERRAGTSCRCGGVLFTNTRGLLGMTGTAKEILNIWRAKEEHFTP